MSGTMASRVRASTEGVGALAREVRLDEDWQSLPLGDDLALSYPLFDLLFLFGCFC